jgi:hypothetical protein
MANIYMKKYSTTLAINVMRMETSLRFHFNTVRMAIIKITTNA